jgi:hypothetical protein
VAVVALVAVVAVVALFALPAFNEYDDETTPVIPAPLPLYALAVNDPVRLYDPVIVSPPRNKYRASACACVNADPLPLLKAKDAVAAVNAYDAEITPITFVPSPLNDPVNDPVPANAVCATDAYEDDKLLPPAFDANDADTA